MLIFISGSMNSGKTTTSQALAKKIGAVCIDVDSLRETIPNFNLETDLDKVMDLAILEINKQLALGNKVVANYILRRKDYLRLLGEVDARDILAVTLAPKLEVAQSQRGERVLTDWEVERVAHHYERGIAAPDFGHIIDNSDMTVDETVNRIIDLMNQVSSGSS